MQDIPEGTALLVIDVQECGRMAFDEAGIAMMPGFDERVSRTADVVAQFRAQGRHVLFTQEVHRPDLLDIGRELDGAEGVHCVDGEPGTDLEIVLRGMGIHTLVLVGTLTDCCVHYTFVDAHQRDLHVKILVDCVGGFSVEAHEAALRSMVYLQRDCLQRSLVGAL